MRPVPTPPAEQAIEPKPDVPERHAYWRFMPILLIVCLLAIGYGLGWQRYISLEQLSLNRGMLRNFVERHFLISLALSILAYSAAVTVSFPATWVLTVACGFAFGALLGGIAAAVSATIGATVLFLAARSAAGDFLRRRASGWVARLASGFERDAFGYLLSLRLVPVIPFFVLNIAPALLRVGIGPFVAATFLGILPGTAVYAFLGQSLDDMVLSAQRAGHALTVQDIVTPQLGGALAALGAPGLLSVWVRRIRGRAVDS